MELVSRGKKDAYFIQNAQRTWFGTAYSGRSASARDTVNVYPENPAQFGATVDIELPRSGDVLKSVDIRVLMPTWLPPEVAALNRSHIIEIESNTPGVRAQYGWTNGIINFVIEKWALFADHEKLAEGYGEINTWYPLTETTHNKAPVRLALSGCHNGSDIAVQRNATLPELAFRVPIPGCQRSTDTGLPLCALRAHQRLFLRLWIPDKSKLAESTAIARDLSSGLPIYDVCPAPWGNRPIWINGVLSPYRTLQGHMLKGPYLYSRCDLLHLEPEAREALARSPMELTFQTQMAEYLTFDENTWIPGYQMQKRLEVRGYFQGLYVRFFSEARALQNKYRDSAAPGGGEWITNMSLVVNGVQRIYNWQPKKLRELVHNIQLGRDIEDNLYFMIFGREVEGQPGGACYLARTHKATLTFQVSDFQVDPVLKRRLVYTFLLGIGWSVLDIRDGRATLRFPD
jgi:hypothetical protein